MDREKAENLVKSFKEGRKEDSMKEIYEETIVPVYRFVYSRIGNKHIAEDIVSETYLTLQDILGNYDGSSKIETFIIGIANNKLKQYYASIDKEILDFDENIILIDENNEDIDNYLDKEKVERILNNLKENYRDVLTYRFLKAYSIKETAKKMNISEENVRVMQNRAIKKALETAQELFLNESK